MRVDSSLYNKERISYSSFFRGILSLSPSGSIRSLRPGYFVMLPLPLHPSPRFLPGNRNLPLRQNLPSVPYDPGPGPKTSPAGIFHKRMPPTTESDTPSCSFFPSPAAAASGMIALGERLPFGPSDPGPILRQPDLRIALIFRPSPSAARSDARSTEALSDVFPPAGTDRAARCGLPPPRPGSFIIRLSHHFSSSRIAPRPIFISLPQASGPPHLATSYFFCNVLR